jgi:hypothetical protein
LQKAGPGPSKEVQIPEFTEKGSQIAAMYYLTNSALDFYDFVVNIKRQSEHLADNFKAGRISKYI